MTDTAHERSGPYRAVLHRWPTALALAVVGLMLADGLGDLPDAVEGLAVPVLLLQLEYLILTQLGRRGASWAVVGSLVVVVLVISLLDVVPLEAVLAGLALVFLVLGAITGTPYGRGEFGIQAAGMLGFGAIALVALAVDPDLGRYLVAAGWFLHGVWDVVHLKRDKVVSRTYAEACGVIDISVAAALLFLV
ncbi:hypothetical protein [Spirillospora sp. NPDC047279]|uniref:hypothetical protein n=1 Tax=Spirillospora sp. NPDC047279 TaxID=3155478 RepID=UPI0033C55DBF